MTHAPSRPRRITASEKIIALLKVRPRTSMELTYAAPMGMRQRISDLRKAGWGILCRRHPTKPVNWYILVHGPRGKR